MKQKRSALDRTAAERNHVAEATRRRRKVRDNMANGKHGLLKNQSLTE